MSKSSRSND